MRGSMINTTKIDELYAWVSINDNGVWGIIAAVSPDGHMPLVSLKLHLMEIARPMVSDAAKRMNRTAHLVRFTNAEILDTIKGATVQ